ncbi:hypothetical protein [Microbulbifer sp. SSSA005]|uniref:hypothetical protein n=1 Tax=Microbulbifer sp. SSSA005 TaxID=3243378 RepID=UPI00403A1BA9
MEERLRKLCRELRKMDSNEASAWLLRIYPVTNENWGEAITLIPHRSWKKKDQVCLAKYYLSEIPYASARGYEAFTSIMSVSSFIEVVSEFVPVKSEKQDLLKYYLPAVLKQACKTDRDKELVDAFINIL